MLLSFFNFFTADGQVLEASVTKSYKLDNPYILPAHTITIDPDFILNTNALATGVSRLNGRYLYDYGSSYGVVDPKFEKGFYYYKSNGQCYAYDFYIGNDFPKKLEKYNAYTHRLTHVGTVFSPYKGMLYELNGKLNNTWEGLNCILPDGTSCGTRTMSRE